MPLTELQFQLRITPETERLMRCIHAFLHDHSNLAYNEQELAQAIDMAADATAIHTAARELMFLGGVDARHHEGQTYYRYLEAIPELE